MSIQRVQKSKQYNKRLFGAGRAVRFFVFGNSPLSEQTAGCFILCFSHVHWDPYVSALGCAITASLSLPAERVPVYLSQHTKICLWHNLIHITLLLVSLACRGCRRVFEWSHWAWIARPSCFDLEGTDFHATHAAMDRNRKCTMCGGAMMLLLLGHMTTALEVPLDREYYRKTALNQIFNFANNVVYEYVYEKINNRTLDM